MLSPSRSSFASCCSRRLRSWDVIHRCSSSTQTVSNNPVLGVTYSLSTLHNRLWVTVNHGQQDAGGAIWNTASLFPFLHGTHVETESVRKFLATQLHALPYRKNMLCRRIVDDAAR